MKSWSIDGFIDFEFEFEFEPKQKPSMTNKNCTRVEQLKICIMICLNVDLSLTNTRVSFPHRKQIQQTKKNWK